MVFYCLLVGVFIKIIMNYSLLRTFTNIGFPPYYGFITATILGYVISTLACFLVLYYKYKVSFESTVKLFVDILCGSLLMVFVLTICRFFIPIQASARLINLLIILLYACIGSVVYFLYAYQSKLTHNVFGGHFLRSISKILLRK